MKLPIFLLVSTLLLTYTAAEPPGNRLVPYVDERVELLSIAGRLANLAGYHDQHNVRYAKQIDDYFAPHRNHPLIQRLKVMKVQLEAAPWELPAVAMHLSNPPRLEALVPFDDTSNVDDWESRTLHNAEFVGLIQKFYRDTKAEVFFQSQAKYYQAVSDHYQTKGVLLKTKWAEDFFGVKPTEQYYPVLALGIRQGAYMRINFANNRRNTVTIFETTSFDAQGLPTTFTKPAIPRLMLHEYIHAFTNQMVDKHLAELQPCAEVLLRHPKVYPLVQNTFYGNWQYLLYESLVRATSIKYMASTKSINPNIEEGIVAEERAGFLWIRGLVRELDKYEADRTKYPTFADYMPQIIAFFRKTAEEYK